MARFNPGWKMTVFVLLLLPLLLKLGFWQLSRADEKRQIIDEISLRQSAAPTPLSSAHAETYALVMLDGQYDGRHFLLDNRVFQGVVGFEVLSVFNDINAGLVLVNRGFIKGVADRSSLPEIPTSTLPIRLTGFVQRNLGEPFLLEEQTVSSAWPKVIQAYEPSVIAHYLPNIALKDAYIRLDEGQQSGFDFNYVAINVQPEKHTAYAVQWFAMSGVLVLLYILFGLGKLTALSRSNNDN